MNFVMLFQVVLVIESSTNCWLKWMVWMLKRISSSLELPIVLRSSMKPSFVQADSINWFTFLSLISLLVSVSSRLLSVRLQFPVTSTWTSSLRSLMVSPVLISLKSARKLLNPLLETPLKQKLDLRWLLRWILTNKATSPPSILCLKSHANTSRKPSEVLVNLSQLS